MIIRRLFGSDIDEVTRIHVKAFSGFFLSQMGESFLRLYYKSLLDHKKGFGFGTFDTDCNLLGFSVATTYSRGFNKDLVLKSFFPFLTVGIKVLFTKPKSLLRLVRNLSKNVNHIDDGNYAELFSIAVDPEIQGRGIGKLLLISTEKAASENGCNRIVLTTDFYNNDDVINFYSNLGYHIYYEFVTYPNRKMNKMIKNI